MAGFIVKSLSSYLIILDTIFFFVVAKKLFLSWPYSHKQLLRYSITLVIKHQLPRQQKMFSVNTTSARETGFSSGTLLTINLLFIVPKLFIF